MILSRYTTREEVWQERIDTMRADLAAGDFGRLYFLLALSLCDAYDTHDYDRHKILEETITAMRKHDYEGIDNGIAALENLENE